MWTETLVSLRTDTHLTPYTACSNGSGRTLLGTVARTLTKKNYIYICIFIYTVYIYPIKRFSVSLHLNAWRVSPVPSAGTVRTTAFGPVLGGFGTGLLLLLLTGLTNLLGWSPPRQTNFSPLAPPLLDCFFFSTFFFFSFFPLFFLHFCFLGTKSSRLVSENTINKINHDSESLIIHDVRGWYDESVARRWSPSSLSLRGGVVTVEDLYIYTYIYICIHGDIYMYVYILKHKWQHSP